MLEQKDLEQIKELLSLNTTQKVECYANGVSEGKQHATMSPETAEHLGIIKDDINQIKISIVGLPQEIYEKCDKKFASKLVEKVVYTLLTISFIGALSFFIKTATNAFF